MARSKEPRIAILGAGPVGLEAGLAARKLNLPFTIFERGRVGEHLLRWGHVKLFTPFGLNVTPLGREAVLAVKSHYTFPADDLNQTGREFVTTYLQPIAESLGAKVQTETQVLRIARQDYFKMDGPGDPRRSVSPFRLLVRDKTRERVEEADVILDCTGVFGQHRWAGAGGIPAPGELQSESAIVFGIDDILGERKGHYQGRMTLLVGSGYSAATSACLLADLSRDHPSTWVTWIGRDDNPAPLRRYAGDPLKERDRLAARANNLATRSDDNVEFFPATLLESIESLGQDRGFRVTTRGAAKIRTLEVERIIANVGYTPDTNIFRELQFDECPATQAPRKVAAFLEQHQVSDCLRVPPMSVEILKNPEPQFFILGAKSFGRKSAFLMKTGYDQVHEVLRSLAGKR